MFEEGRVKASPSPRHRMSPKQRLQRISPRSRFSRMKAVMLEEGNPSENDNGVSSSFDSNPSDTASTAFSTKKKTVTIAEPKLGDDKRNKSDFKETLSRPFGSSVPPKSPKSQLRLTTKMDSLDDYIFEDTVAPASQQSPRQPKSPRKPVSPQKSPLMAKLINAKYQELSDDTEEVATAKASPSKQSRFFRKSPKFTPDWQQNRQKILGSKKYLSPLSLRRQQKAQKEAEDKEEIVTENIVPISSIFWSEDTVDDSRQEVETIQNQAKEMRSSPSPLKVQVPQSPAAKRPMLSPPMADFTEGRSPRQSKQGDREGSTRSPSRSPSVERSSPLDISAGPPIKTVIASPRKMSKPVATPEEKKEEEQLSMDKPSPVNTFSGPPIKTVIASPRKMPKPAAVVKEKEPVFETFESQSSEEEELEAIIKDLCPSGDTCSTISSKDAFHAKPAKNQASIQSPTERTETCVETVSAEVVEESQVKDETCQTIQPPSETIARPQTKDETPNTSRPEDDSLATGVVETALEAIERVETPTMKSTDATSVVSEPLSHTSKPSPRLSRVARLKTMKANSPAILAAKVRIAGPETPKQPPTTTQSTTDDDKEQSAKSQGSSKELSNTARPTVDVSRVSLLTSRHGKLRSTPLNHLLKQRHMKKVPTSTNSSANGTNQSSENQVDVPRKDSQLPKTVTSPEAITEATPKKAFGEDKEQSSSVDEQRTDAISAEKTNAGSSQLFPVNRSYRNTRLAKKYLHRQSVDPSSTPRHALRGSPATPRHTNVRKEDPENDKKSSKQTFALKLDPAPVTTVIAATSTPQKKPMDPAGKKESLSSSLEQDQVDAASKSVADHSSVASVAAESVSKSELPAKASLISAATKKKIPLDAPSDCSKSVTEQANLETEEEKGSEKIQAELEESSSLGSLGTKTDLNASLGSLGTKTDLNDIESKATEISDAPTASGETSDSNTEEDSILLSESLTSDQTSVQSNDILSRTSRRRHHPALARKRGGKKSKTIAKVNEKFSDTQPIKAQNPEEIDVEPNVGETEAEGIPNSASMNSIFGENKGIAMCYLKYSKARDANFKRKKDRIKKRANVDAEAESLENGNDAQANFVTTREENMHSFHEMDTEDAKSILELTSDITVSMGSDGSSDEQNANDEPEDDSSPKKGDLDDKSRISTPQSQSSSGDKNASNLKAQDMESKYLGEILSTAVSQEKCGDESWSAPARSPKGKDPSVQGSESLHGKSLPSFDDTSLDDLAQSLIEEEELRHQQSSLHKQYQREVRQAASSQSLISMPSQRDLYPDPVKDGAQLHRVATSDSLSNQFLYPALKEDKAAMEAHPDARFDYEHRLLDIAHAAHVERQKQDLQATKSFNGDESRISTSSIRRDKPRSPAKHSRRVDQRRGETEFKYQDLKSLSLQDNPTGFGSQRSYDSDLPGDDDIFSGIDDIGFSRAPAADIAERSLGAPPPPPPPPPPPLVDDRYGRVLDSQNTTRSVHSDITTSLLAGEKQYGQSGRVISEDRVLRTVNSDITSSILGGGQLMISQYYQNAHDEEGFTLIDNLDERAEVESIDDESEFLRQHLGPSESSESSELSAVKEKEVSSETQEEDFRKSGRKRNEMPDAQLAHPGHDHTPRKKSSEGNRFLSGKLECMTDMQKAKCELTELTPSKSQQEAPRAPLPPPSPKVANVRHDGTTLKEQGQNTNDSKPLVHQSSPSAPKLALPRTNSQPDIVESKSSIMDSSMIMRMGLAMMGSFSEGVKSFAKEMPSGENLFGFSENRNADQDQVDIAESGTNEDSLTEARSNEGIENKLTSFSGDSGESGQSNESEDSRYIPDIDDQDEDPHHAHLDDHTQDTDDLESAISLVLLEEVQHVVEYNPTNDSEISQGQIEALEKFSELCSTQGIEVMKMNRRGKWQTRFLTVSSEMIDLERSGKLSQYPKALLWVKKFNPRHSYSFEALSSEGRGGVEFVNIESTGADEADGQPPKLGGKFKKSYQLNLHYTCGENLRPLALRFKTKEDADSFAASIETIVDVLDHEGVY